MKIAFLNIATNKYINFLPELLKSINKYFLPEVEKHFYIFTNNLDYPLNHKNISKILIKAKGWPGDTYYRYHHFLSIKEALKNYDYVYYLDADMKIVDYVGKEVLTDLLGVQHPGFVVNKQGTPEDKQKESTAYLEKKNVVQYCCGGFQGGSPKEYLKLSEIISHNIDIDDKNNILAVWHDESHVNRYFADNPPTKILNAGYCAPESAWQVPFPYKIIALDKSATKYKGR